MSRPIISQFPDHIRDPLVVVCRSGSLGLLMRSLKSQLQMAGLILTCDDWMLRTGGKHPPQTKQCEHALGRFVNVGSSLSGRAGSAGNADQAGQLGR